jgi:hypothetical protein
MAGIIAAYYEFNNTYGPVEDAYYLLPGPSGPRDSDDEEE